MVLDTFKGKFGGNNNQKADPNVNSEQPMMMQAPPPYTSPPMAPPPAYPAPSPNPVPVQSNPQPGGPQPAAAAQPIVINCQQQPQQMLPRLGNCKKCNVGNVIESYATWAIIMTIICCPLGIFCLFCCKDKRCSHCGGK